MINRNFYIEGGVVDNKPKWNTLSHNGPFFPEKYIKHDIPIIYNNNKINLPSNVEEYLTLYTRYIDTDYIERSNFKKNFLKDLKQIVPKNLDFIITDFNNIDFSLIKNHLDEIKEKNKNKTKEEKLKEKEERLKLEEPYMYCLINNIQEKVGNYKMEPLGIFLGRGNHPKLGRVKKRINPEDVIINIGSDATVPKPNIGGEWKQIVHDKTKIWLASWKDTITGKTKYIFTSMDSIFKSKSDEEKFDLARKLKRKVKAIREKYFNELLSEDLKTKQLATALYFIDKLALRVGGKKDTKEQADTVGVTSLRKEHITLLENNVIKLDFLGKDSIRYCNKVQVDKLVYDNLKLFLGEEENKKSDLFDLIDAKSLNEYLNSYMEGLTAKVWRTYNASNTFQKELDKINEEKLSKIPENQRINYLIGFFEQANTAVALLCNHQKNVSTNHTKIAEKLNDRIKKLKKRRDKIKNSKTKNKGEKINKINGEIKILKLKKENKEKMKNVSLGTSKTNYIDPRIIFSFMDKFSIPKEKLFTKTLLSRFKWASEVDKTYRF